jgi:hypothetical protein
VAAVQPPASGATAPPWQTLGTLLHELPGLVSDRVHLLSLEVKRAGVASAHIAVLAVLAAIMLSTAWLALWAGVIVGLMQVGAHWLFAFGLVLLLNVGGAAWALMRLKSLTPMLGLPATLRHLTLAPAGEGARLEEERRTSESRRVVPPGASDPISVEKPSDRAAAGVPHV